MSDVLPITTPPRSELWRRIQLARSLLAHRDLDPATRNLVLRALDGEQIDTMKGAS